MVAGRSEERSALADEWKRFEDARAADAEAAQAARQSHEQAVRDARAGGRAAGQSERAGLTTALEAARSDVARLEREAGEARDDAARLEREAGEAQEDLAGAVADVHGIAIDVVALQARYTAVRLERDELRDRMRVGSVPARPSITTPGGPDRRPARAVRVGVT